MRLIAGENETTYEAHQSRPAWGEKRQEPSPYPRDLAAPFKQLFPDTSRQIESFWGERMPRHKGRRMRRRGRGGERAGGVIGGMKGDEEWRWRRWDVNSSLLDFFRAGSGFEKEHHIHFELWGTIAGKREIWGQAGRRPEQKGKRGREQGHISWNPYH